MEIRMVDDSVPVGTILPYAGICNNNILMAQGWSICDGQQYEKKYYPELFDVIGTVNGGDGITYFNLPDLRGRFLRGTDTSGKIDVGAGSRTAPNSGGATGPRTGSVEGYATAAPTNAFLCLVPNIPDGTHNAYQSAGDGMLSNADGSQTIIFDSGGDDETRPVNAGVQYIIKMTSTTLSSPTKIPLGAIATLAGPQLGPVGKGNYLLCDGSPQNGATGSGLEALFDAIGLSCGGTGTSFCLPDYRGRFLRGVDGGAKRDPDAGARAPMAAGGNSGDSPGSIQGFGTALPSNPFSFSIDLATTQKDSSRSKGHDNSRFNDGSSTVTIAPVNLMPPLGKPNGDKESRPVNINADFYIFSNYDTAGADVFPIGGVIAMAGGWTPPADGSWKLCNGGALVKAQYPALFDVIGTCYGGGDSTFNIPDYHGQFIRGTDHGTGRDPDAASRTSISGGASGDQVGSAQGWATGFPVKAPFSANIPHLPTDPSSNAAAITHRPVSNWNPTATFWPVGGGDAETRPINVNVDFYIKCF
jgi:microcystin-dependent protein